MRMVFLQYLADRGRALFIAAVGQHALVIHGIEDPSVDRFQPVGNIGKGSPHYDAHSVVDIGVLHLVFYLNELNFSHQRFEHLLPPFIAGLSARAGVLAQTGPPPQLKK